MMQQRKAMVIEKQPTSIRKPTVVIMVIERPPTCSKTPICWMFLNKPSPLPPMKLKYRW